MNLTKSKINKSTLTLLKVLSDNWFNYLSINELVKLTKLTKPTIYTIKKSLIKNRIITQIKNGRIKIDFRNDFSYKFKLLNDSEKLLPQKEQIKELIYQILNHYQHEYDKDLDTFLVFGSVAEFKASKQSDIDFLVIVKQRKEIDLKRFLEKNINIIEMDETEFEKAYIKGDDFIISCLSSNLLIVDNGYFRQFLIKATLPKITQDIINIRKNKLSKEIRNLIPLIKKPDEFLVGRFKKYLIQKARIILLEHDIIPTSKNFVLKKVKRFNKSLVQDYKKANIKNIRKLVMKYV